MVASQQVLVERAHNDPCFFILPLVLKCSTPQMIVATCSGLGILWFLPYLGLFGSAGGRCGTHNNSINPLVFRLSYSQDLCQPSQTIILKKWLRSCCCIPIIQFFSFTISVWNLDMLHNLSALFLAFFNLLLNLSILFSSMKMKRAPQP